MLSGGASHLLQAARAEAVPEILAGRDGRELQARDSSAHVCTGGPGDSDICATGACASAVEECQDGTAEAVRDIDPGGHEGRGIVRGYADARDADARDRVS